MRELELGAYEAFSALSISAMSISWSSWPPISSGLGPAGRSHITVVAGFDSVEAAQAFRVDPELKQAMGQAGVVGAPRFEIFEEVESVQY